MALPVNLGFKQCLLGWDFLTSNGMDTAIFVFCFFTEGVASHLMRLLKKGG